MNNVQTNKCLHINKKNIDKIKNELNDNVSALYVKFSFDDNNTVENFMNQIDKFPSSIKAITLDCNYAAVKNLSFLEKLENLEDLRGEDVSGEEDDEYQGNTNIHLLNLPITIKTMYFENCAFENFKFLSRLVNLEELEFRYCDDLVKLKKGDLPKSLKWVELGLDDESFKKSQSDVFEGLNKLEYLRFYPFNNTDYRVFKIPESVKNKPYGNFVK